ncbi:MAG: hypothetical protein LBR82_02035 [Desulfovibrio sp.]|jgi:dTDP-4-amino-4,6-dideoxygalactose transaminase|nr:hypothetical protein [Desulfovibrio sp.]
MTEFDRDELKGLVRNAVAEALKASNLIDGPTHLAHHQAIEEMLQAKRAATRAGIRTAVTITIGGLISLIILGVKEWTKG